MDAQFVLGLVCGIGFVGLVFALFPALVKPRT